jgi:chromosome segregation ATPase
MTMYLVAKNDELNAAHKTLKEVTEQRDGLRSGIDYASDQLTAVTEQRDAVTLRLGDTQVRMFNAERQRDRLAEALRECREDSIELLGERDWWQNEPRLDYQKRYQETRDNVTRADEALQSLTTNKPDQERKSPASDCSEI